MYIIKTKNKKYNGILSGLIFKNGEAKAEKLSDFDIVWFEALEAMVEHEEIPGKAKKKKDKE